MSKLILIFFIILQPGNREEYSQLGTSIHLESRVVDVWDDRGTTYITTDTGDRYWIQHSRNYEYRNAWLNDFIQVNDLITKHNDSDTLLISRNSNVYTFVIGKFLNEHLSTSTKIDPNFAFRIVILLGLFILIFGSYTRTTVLLTWNNYKIDRHPVNNIKNALELIASGHKKKGIFVFLLILLLGSTLLFCGILLSFWIGGR